MKSSDDTAINKLLNMISVLNHDGEKYNTKFKLFSCKQHNEFLLEYYDNDNLSISINSDSITMISEEKKIYTYDVRFFQILVELSELLLKVELENKKIN